MSLGFARAFWKAFHSEDRGQDLAEYCLLTALIALVAGGLLIHFAGGMQAVWDSANTALAAGGHAATTTDVNTSTPAH